MKEKGLLTDITRSSEVYRIYRSDTYDRSLAQTLKDDYEAYVFRLQSRYEKNQTAAHLIGYLNEAEEKGVSGLELFCEDRLKVSGSYLSGQMRREKFFRVFHPKLRRQIRASWHQIP